MLSRTPRLRGLDGQLKMSKSLNNQIDLRMSPAETANRVAMMTTDPQRVKQSDPGRPECCNVSEYYRVFAPLEADSVAAECRAAARGCVECKRLLAGRINDFLAVHRARRAELAAQPDLIEDILTDGARRARTTAREMLAEVHVKLGLGASPATARPFAPHGLFV